MTERAPSPPPHPIGTRSAIVERLFDAPVIAVEAVPRSLDEQLYPEEREHVHRAVAKRKAEFGTARVIAREALGALGIAPRALVPRDDRAPRWPAGAIGSISHTDGCCIVVVGRDRAVRALGVDVELRQALSAEVTARVCTPRELAWLGSVAPERRAAFAVLLFSAKETLYKCQHPIIGAALDFTDVELSLDVEAGTFTPRVRRGPSGAERVAIEAIRGRYSITDRFVLTGAAAARP